MKFCPKCGKSTEELIHDLCKDCYFKDHDIIERIKETNIHICEECGKIKTRNWAHKREVDYLERTVTENIKLKRGVVLEKIKVNLEMPQRHPFNKRSKAIAKVNITAKVDNGKISLDYEMPFSVLHTKCPECMKINNGYYEGILQLRSRSHGSFEEACEFVREDVEHQKNYGVAIVEEEDLPEGIDFQVSKKIYLQTLAKKILKRFGGTVETHAKLVTYDKLESKDLTRLTVLVRLPKFEPGDVIEIKNKLLLVNKINKQSVYGTDIVTGKKTNYNHREFKPTPVVKKIDMEKNEDGNLTFIYENKTYEINPNQTNNSFDDNEEQSENDDDDSDEEDVDKDKDL